MEVADTRGLEKSDRAMFEGPYFFGDLILEVDETHITSILPYHRASDPYRILDRGRDFVILESTDAAGSTQVLRCRFRGGQLLVPVPEHGFHEVFVRVPDAE